MSKKQVSLFTNISQNRDIVCKFYDFWNWYRDFFWSVNLGKKKYGTAALIDTMQKWESVMLTFSRAGALTQSHEKKLQMNQFKSTFASTINVKMIMTKTNDFFSRFKGTGHVTKSAKPPTWRCQVKIVANWQRLW